MGRVWAETGQARRSPAAAERSRPGSKRACGGRSRAVAAPAPRRLALRPRPLLDGERPYDSLTEARLGSYWNLVMPYALASGLFAPGSPEANGSLRYLLRHGSRLLGVVRAGAYALYPDPVFPTSGTDQVYGINVARFLADNDEADQLVLSLYGSLAVAMTPEHVRLGRGRQRCAARRQSTSARCTCRRTARATRRSSRRCARCSCTRPGMPTERRAVSSSRSRRRGRGCARGRRIAVERAADELRSRLVRARGARRLDPRIRWTCRRGLRRSR